MFCLRKIPIGSKAEYNCGTFEGDFNSYYFCIPCSKDFQKIEDRDDYFSDGDYWEYNCFRYSCPSCGDDCGHGEYDETNTKLLFECEECENKFGIERGFD
jgi:DNA-directed RNA polymerase subunit RPC12/RpoP